MDRSEAKKKYKQSNRPMGIYRIKNTQNCKSYVGYSLDLQARINRHKAELKFGSHRNLELLDDWKVFGESSFEFEVLDELALDEKSKDDPIEELHVLKDMWINKLEKSGDVVISF